MFISKLSLSFLQPHTDFSLLTKLRIAAENIRIHLSIRRSDASHIFALGPPRFGTTLVRKIVHANDATCGTYTEVFASVGDAPANSAYIAQIDRL